MTERTDITNLLLTTVLTGILLISGSLQYAFDYLSQADYLHSTAIRVDGCHLSVAQADPVLCCPNKACHQGNTPHRDLGGPEVHSRYKQSQPLVASSRQSTPQQRAGSHIVPPTVALQPQLALQATVSTAPPHALYGIRSTILLI